MIVAAKECDEIP